MSFIKQNIITWYRSFNRKLFGTNWKDLRNLKPISELFGTDRGTPIDRFYIETFLNKNKELIKGSVLEIGNDYYSKLFGNNITKQEILHFTSDNKNATIVGDLTEIKTLKPEIADCFICTQTINFIYDFKSAIHGIYYLLKFDGIALITLSGISQISRYDMDRWGDFWRFTDKSTKLMFIDVFGEDNISIECYGNVLASISFLEGISAEELKKEELLYHDPNYQITITVKAIKKKNH